MWLILDLLFGTSLFNGLMTRLVFRLFICDAIRPFGHVQGSGGPSLPRSCKNMSQSISSTGLDLSECTWFISASDLQHLTRKLSRIHLRNDGNVEEQCFWEGHG